MAVALVEPIMAAWPTPSPLEGVKSRKRPIFNIESGRLVVGGAVSRISGVKMTLESRIVAANAVGQNLIDVLSGQQQLAKGKAKTHSDLIIREIGSQNVVDGDLDAVVAEAVQSRPHVLVFHVPSAQVAWSPRMDELFCSEQLVSFRGAVVVITQQETPAVLSLCNERWVASDGWLFQERLSGERLEILDDVLGENSKIEGVDDLLFDVAKLSQHFFQEDSVTKSEERGWILSLLVERSEQNLLSLCGFICYRTPSGNKNDLHVARLAVPESQSHSGHGKRLMNWILRKAARLPQSQCAWVSLSSLDTAMPFYEKFGFIDMTCDDLEDPDHFQTWMELPNESAVEDVPKVDK